MGVSRCEVKGQISDPGVFKDPCEAFVLRERAIQGLRTWRDVFTLSHGIQDTVEAGIQRQLE